MAAGRPRASGRPFRFLAHGLRAVQFSKKRSALARPGQSEGEYFLVAVLLLAAMKAWVPYASAIRGTYG